MRITICGSVQFAKQLVDIYYQLEKLGHQPQMHKDMLGIADGTAKKLINEVNSNHGEAKKKHNFIKIWYNLITSGDAILVCNFDKDGARNYIGGNTLMEMGFAHVHNKKIFLYNPLPENSPYLDEIKAMQPIILNGDLTKIKS